MPDDKLFSILYDLVTWSIGQRRVSEIEFDKATAQLNALFLSQALDLISGVQVEGPPHPQLDIYKADLIDTFRAKYGGK